MAWSRASKDNRLGLSYRISHGCSTRQFLQRQAAQLCCNSVCYTVGHRGCVMRWWAPQAHYWTRSPTWHWTCTRLCAALRRTTRPCARCGQRLCIHCSLSCLALVTWHEPGCSVAAYDGSETQQPAPPWVPAQPVLASWPGIKATAACHADYTAIWTGLSQLGYQLNAAAAPLILASNCTATRGNGCLHDT